MRVKKSKPMVGYKILPKKLPSTDPYNLVIGRTYRTTSIALADTDIFGFYDNIHDAFRLCMFRDNWAIYKVHAWGTVMPNEYGQYVGQNIMLMSKLQLGKVLADLNTGIGNYGIYNEGRYNSGERNLGSWNSGDNNVGCWNIGYHNVGDGNIGCGNYGDYNHGDHNCGQWNHADSTEHCFFTTKSNKRLHIFNKPYKDGQMSFWAPDFIKVQPTVWVPEKDLDTYYRRMFPASKILGGWLVIRDHKEAFRISFEVTRRKADWPKQRQMLLDLPNFDAGIFEEITGITPKDLEL